MRKKRKTGILFLMIWIILAADILISAEYAVLLAEAVKESAEKDNGEESTGLQIGTYQEMLVGPQEIDDAAGELGSLSTLDLEVLYTFIQGKEAEWKESQAQKMEEAGIPRDQQYFVYGKDYRDMTRQILAMTAVFRNYTFYNRIVCQWYADNLWNESITYQITGRNPQQSASEFLLPAAGAAADMLGVGGASLMTAMEGAEKVLESQYRVTVILDNRPREEIYDIDSFKARIPIEWGGWTEEKRAECEELLSFGETEFNQVIMERQEKSLLYSPVPFYKQGAAEWGTQPFGNGTLASDACCPTAIAMAVSYLKGKRITPAEVAARYDNDIYRNKEQGSYGGKMCMAAGLDYGLKVEAGVDSLSGAEIRTALESGAVIVMSMKPDNGGGRYATVYHYVTLAGLTEDGRVIVNNPGINTDITYDDMETVLDNQSGRGYGIFSLN